MCLGTFGEKKLSITATNISSAPFFHSFPSGIPIVWVLHLLKLSHSSRMLFFCFILFSLCISALEVSIEIFKFYHSFLRNVESTDGPIKGFLLFHCIGFLTFPFDSFRVSCLCLYYPFVLECCLFPLKP